MPTPKGAPIWWEDAKHHLRRVDQKIAQIIDNVEEPPLTGEGDIVKQSVML